MYVNLHFYYVTSI